MTLVAEKLSDALNTWKSRNAFSEVEYWQKVLPVLDQSIEDYRVVFECGFYPTSYSKASLELWLTDSGDIAVGLERWNRVANHANLRTKGVRFAGGFEPRAMSIEEILELCDLVRAGDIDVVAYGAFGKLMCCDVRLRTDSKLPKVSMMSGLQKSLVALKLFAPVHLSYQKW